MNNQNDPTNPDTAWEEAMSRDFDARVRDLHEAPLDISSVKGKAGKIKRNRRAAVAGGILGVAAIITPVAVLANDGGSDAGREPQFAPEAPDSSVIADPATGLDYLQGSNWHQADGDVVEIAKGDYYEAAVWDGNLVTLSPAIEVYPTMTIFDADGNVVDRMEEDVVGFAVSADGTVLAYTNGDGQLIARWDGNEESVLAEGVTDTGGGESVGGAPVSVLGTAPCTAENGNCLVRINTYESGCVDFGTGGPPAPSDALSCGDEQGDRLVYVNDLTEEGYQCGAVQLDGADTPAWSTCDYDLQELSPDGQYVVGGQVDSDGLGPKEFSILDAETGDLVTSWSAPGSSFIWSDIAWSETGYLVFSVYDVKWRLLALDPRGDGEPVEVAGPEPGDEVSNPWTLIHH
jgi:hypothetical protein